MSISVVVTGANGFIGNHIVEKILKLLPGELSGKPVSARMRFSNFEEAAKERDEAAITKVYGVDLVESLARSNASRFAAASRYEFVQYDKLAALLRSLPKPPEIVIHSGACSTTTETRQEIFDELNLNYSKMLWDYCAQHDVPFIYASSAAVYGNGDNGFSDRKQDCGKYESLNLYGKSKLDFDLWTLEQQSTPPSWFGLRYFNVYGPFEGHKGGQASMIYHGFNQITRTGKICLFQSNTSQYSDGGQMRDFVYVQDIVNATMELARLSLARKEGRKPNASSSVNSNIPSIDGNGLFLNVGTGQARSWNDLAKAIFEALSMPVNIEYIPMPDNLRNQYQNYTCADLSSWKSLGVDLNLTPLEKGAREYVQRFLCRGL